MHICSNLPVWHPPGKVWHPPGKVYFQIKYPKPMRIFDYITATQAVNESISAWTRRVEGLAIAAEAQTPLSTSLFTADVFVTS